MDIFRVSLIIENGVSTTQRVEAARIVFDNAVIRDIKFVDDIHLMLVYQNSGKFAPDQ